MTELLRRPWPLCAILALGCVLAALWGLATGEIEMSLAQLFGALGLPGAPAPDPVALTAVRELRAPRIVLALLAGGALGASGAALQGIFRNPLADPALVGVSAGAALVASGAIVLGAPLLRAVPAELLLPLAAFAGGLLATACVMRLALVDGHTRVATMLLAGLAINALCSAGIGLFAHLASDSALRELMFWMYGSLGKAGWSQIAWAAPVLLACIALIPLHARALDALLLGEAEAGHLGVAVEQVKRRLTLLVVLGVGAAVSLAGIIGFVGLVVPTLVRLVAGPGNRAVLPASALLGALLLLLADTGARTLLAPVELPIGILTALIGGPFFLALLLRYRAAPEVL